MELHFGSFLHSGPFLYRLRTNSLLLQQALKAARDQCADVRAEKLTDLQTRAKLGDKAEEYFEQWQTAQQEVDRMKAAIAKRTQEVRAPRSGEERRRPEGERAGVSCRRLCLRVTSLTR